MFHKKEAKVESAKKSPKKILLRFGGLLFPTKQHLLRSSKSKSVCNDVMFVTAYCNWKIALRQTLEESFSKIILAWVTKNISYRQSQVQTNLTLKFLYQQFQQSHPKTIKLLKQVSAFLSQGDLCKVAANLENGFTIFLKKFCLGCKHKFSFKSAMALELTLG